MRWRIQDLILRVAGGVGAWVENEENVDVCSISHFISIFGRHVTCDFSELKFNVCYDLCLEVSAQLIHAIRETITAINEITVKLWLCTNTKANILQNIIMSYRGFLWYAVNRHIVC